VYLPRVEQEPEALPAVRVASGEQTGSETILLVEDQPQVRELARMSLSEKGYTVLVASSPEDAEGACARHGAEIHLLLTDLIMPGITGRELAKRLTARHPKMRVLCMSGYTFGITTQTGMQSGLLEDGVAFLQKPFTPSALSEKVREVLDRSVAASRS
jgi:DNA-binding NtrC family response regulator